MLKSYFGPMWSLDEYGLTPLAKYQNQILSYWREYHTNKGGQVYAPGEVVDRLKSEGIVVYKESSLIFPQNVTAIVVVTMYEDYLPTDIPPNTLTIFKGTSEFGTIESFCEYWKLDPNVGLSWKHLFFA